MYCLHLIYYLVSVNVLGTGWVDSTEPKVR